MDEMTDLWQSIGPSRIMPRFRLEPGDPVVALADMKADHGIRGLPRPVSFGTEGVVEFVVVFHDAVFYRVNWKPNPRQKQEGWRRIQGDHSPDDVGYLLRER